MIEDCSKINPDRTKDPENRIRLSYAAVWPIFHLFLGPSCLKYWPLLTGGSIADGECIQFFCQKAALTQKSIGVHFENVSTN